MIHRLIFLLDIYPMGVYYKIKVHARERFG